MNDPGLGASKTPASHRAPTLFIAEGSPSANFLVEKPVRNWVPWIVAACAIGLLLALILWFGRTPAPPPNAGIDPYAKYLVFRNVEVSQANNFAGDQLTYVDGTLENHGNRTVTSVTVQAAFANISGEAPQMEQVPVSIIRSREPYVDTIPISAAPLAPGKSQDFRLIFDNISPMWNQQAPQLTVLHAGTRP